MSIKQVIVSIIGLGVMLGLAGCASSTKTVATEVAVTDTIPYKSADRYFVKNGVDTIPEVISSDKEFNKYFGTATVMGDGGQSTAIDFSKEYVIAVVLPQTDYSTEIIPGPLVKDGNRGLVFHCTVKVGEKQSYMVRPVYMAIVDSRYSPNVAIKLSYTPSVLIVYYDREIGNSYLKSAINEMGASIVYDYKNFNAVALRLPTDISLPKAIISLSETKGVLSVQPDGKLIQL
ncbi:MAG: hypothetical protein J6C44_09055 [Muribaculaceae bacterium]|nr:hypothetical protein [Muribaculaceae bacterium]